MTSSLRLEPRDHSSPGSTPRRGFTLIEMLVVIGIILVLMALLLPSANKAYKEANRNSIRADLNAIEQALEAYKSDFGDYPRPGLLNGTFVGGPEVLCWALIAPGPAVGNGAIPGDGFDGPGFRLIPGSPPQGQVHQPYLNVDRFHYGTLTGTSIVVTPWAPGVTIDDRKTVIADRYNNVILYYPRNLAAPTPTTMAQYVGPSRNYPPRSTDPVYDTTDYDRTNFHPFFNLQVIQWSIPGSAYLAQIHPVTTSPMLSAGQMITNPYILWSAGPDGAFGPQLNPAKTMTTGQDDDVTNFQ